MRCSKRWFGAAVGVGLALALAGPGASALSLQDLADGGSITTGSGIVLGDFAIKIRGGKKANKDLSSYLVTGTRTGFDVDVSGAGLAKLKLSYTASVAGPVQGGAVSSLGGASVIGGLTGASVALRAQDPFLGAGKLKQKLKAGRRKLGILKAGLGESDGSTFDEQTVLTIVEQIKLGQKRGAMHTAGLVQHAFGSTRGVVPEPAAAWLVCAALVGLARRARRV